MNRKSLLISTLTLMLTAAGATAFAADAQPSLVGTAVPAAAATRTVVIGPDTAYVNVTGGETIKFVVGDKSFAWDFHVAGNVYHLDLNKIAPAGMLNHEVVAYIANDPTYRG